VNIPLGTPILNWQRRPQPQGIVLTGRLCRLERLHIRHTDALFAAYCKAPDARDWTYLSVGPFAHIDAFRTYIEQLVQQTDPLHFAIIDLNSGQALGTLALMRQKPEHGVVEVGFVAFSSALQRSPLATEAQFLLMSHVFDQLGYRRYEWKCDSLNQRSIHAAQRLGFQYEGTFRQAMVYKGRNRDTAWFSIIDQDWPTIKTALMQWLHPDNFNVKGQQIRCLQSIRTSIMNSRVAT